MGLKLTGSTSTTILHAMKIGLDSQSGSVAGGQNANNMRILQQFILDDKTNTNPVWPGALYGSGANMLLHIPNRGVLQCFNGDVVAVDQASGWPILISALSFAAGGVWNRF